MTAENQVAAVLQRWADADQWDLQPYADDISQVLYGGKWGGWHIAQELGAYRNGLLPLTVGELARHICARHSHMVHHCCAGAHPTEPHLCACGAYLPEFPKPPNIEVVGPSLGCFVAGVLALLVLLMVVVRL